MNHAALETLLAKQEILDCIARGCRAIDRLDRELALSTYHEDALDVHGPFSGGPEEFVDWVLEHHAKEQTQTQHRISNHLCEIEGDVAHAETYIFYTGCNRDGTLSISSARYLDRFERRGGVWKIAVRYAFPEWVVESQVKVVTLADLHLPCILGAPGRDRSDPSYLRPLPDPAPRS